MKGCSGGSLDGTGAELGWAEVQSSAPSVMKMMQYHNRLSSVMLNATRGSFQDVNTLNKP